MIRSHPWNLWPLHVKLFTEEARDVWDALLIRRSKAAQKAAKGTKPGPKATDPPPPSIPPSAHFPPGFTWSVELEGVDGRSGHPEGSGRTAPLCVKDREFRVAWFET
jgi:structure-specific endonuclease subunit SLX1